MWLLTSQHVLFSLLALTVLLARTSAQDCYFPNGDHADAFTPCGSNSKHCCCNTGPLWHDACFSNGFCYSWMMGYTDRGACTEKEWGEECVQPCEDRKSVFILIALTKRLGLTSLPVRSDNIKPVSLCGGADDASISSPYACCGTPPEAAEGCSSGDDGGGFGWLDASIVNFDLTPRTAVASSLTVSTTFRIYVGQSCSQLFSPHSLVTKG